MATKQVKKPETPISLKPRPSPKDHASQSATSRPEQNDASSRSKVPLSPKQFIVSVAANISSQPLPTYDPNVWGVLTAISNNARKRPQGMNMLFTADEHSIGRLVEDVSFRIESNSVSADHCKIYRKRVTNEDTEQSSNSYLSVFLKDTSTNGTYLNWERLRKNSPELKIEHGDIISFSAPPQHELAFAFVYREVLRFAPSVKGACAKRKAEELACENKRLKGIGIGAPEGPLSLDDFRSLQRSNRELRRQLEDQVLTIDTLRSENRATVERHENAIKEIKEAVANSYLDQLKELNNLLDVKQKELVELNRISAEQKHAIEDLSERLTASIQSCTEANEIIKSQKASIAELKVQLDEERDQRREEREKAAVDLKAAVQRAQSEAQEEHQRLSDVALKREKEQQDVINKLEESLRKSSSQVEGLVSKLEEIRQKLVNSDNKVRQLETQFCEAQQASAISRNKVEELEHAMKGLRKELEAEKAAREEAWAKVSALELEVNAAMRDLDYERRRLKGARERIMLRETQLRAFYSTTEEISVLFAKQQEQLKAMQRTLEDEENYDNTSVDIDLNVPSRNVNGIVVREKATASYHGNNTTKAGSTTSAQRVNFSSDEASATEKHDCDMISQEVGENTQEAEFTSAEPFAKGGFGSDIDGVGMAPVPEGDLIGTERVLETESLGIEVEQNIALNRCETLGGDTMQCDYETNGNAPESNEQIQTTCPDTSIHSESNKPLETQNSVEDTEAGGTIRTADLLASEVLGSWAQSTAPSVHGENESPKIGHNEEDRAMALHDSSGLVAESQSTPPSEAAAARRKDEREALTEMIGIVAPDLKEQFGGAANDDFDQQRKNLTVNSDSDTEDCVDSDDDNNKAAANSGSISDAETEGSDQADEDQKHNHAMDEDDETSGEDSVG
ncbi:myosin-9 isoform X2 [Herrania umbratica]|uniref:Myosin-9 isoform X2 n=1 Tax=Herrania umbratica TaxID=108875 RepID=A0A6J0ZYQ0_9ROSI|nr:myosin-9 isoform X2 [Herrania umbratica]